MAQQNDKKPPPSKMKSDKPSGRQVKLSADIIAKIAEGVTLGLRKNEELATYGGISETSFYSYMRRAEADRQKGRDSIYAQLMRAMEEARTRAKAIHSGVIIKAATQGFPQTRSRTVTNYDAAGALLGSSKVVDNVTGKPDWKASLEWLRTNFPDDWAAVANIKLDWRTFAKRLGVSDDDIEDSLAAVAQAFATGAAPGVSARGDDANSVERERFIRGFLDRLEGQGS